MPRGKGYRRSVAARKRMMDNITKQLDFQFRVEGHVAVRGKGRRYPVQQWPVSSLTGKKHKLVIPDESPNKQFILLVGDSHLRSIADGFIDMPGTRYSFGVMSTPGASASQLRTEVVNATLLRSPDAVCLLAPSNNLTASRTIDEASADFASLLYSVCSRWEKVCVVDFPPRLNIAMELQELLRQEYHRVSSLMGVTYCHIAERFSMKNLHLWSRDGVHLSDDHGMPVFVDCVYAAVYKLLETTTAPKPQVVAPRRSPPRVTPRVCVSKGQDSIQPQVTCNPLDWAVVGSKGKVKAKSVVVKDCFIPLNPIKFSSELLEAMDKVLPAEPDVLVECTPVPKKCRVERQTRSSATKRQQKKHQVECTPTVRVLDTIVSATAPKEVDATSSQEVSACFIEDAADVRCELLIEETPTVSPSVSPIQAAPMEQALTLWQNLWLIILYICQSEHTSKPLLN